jgi:hypothetical protein
MWLKDLYQRWWGGPANGRRARPGPPRRCGPRLALERLEDRTVPASFTAASVTELLADINAANLAGGPNTITLATGATFALTAADNTTDGGNGLPVIAAGDNLTILGSGDVIERSTAVGTPAFRLFDVAAGASLTLTNLILQGGLTYTNGYGGVPADGGALYSQGALTLDGVTVRDNTAAGSTPFSPARGGGIWSSGALTLGGNTIVRDNRALGNDAWYDSDFDFLTPPGSACGGGVYVAGGTAALTGVTLSANTARGGSGYAGADGCGGGLYVAGGAVTLTGVTLSANTARGGNGGSDFNIYGGLEAGGQGGPGGPGFGGGLYAAGGTVELHTTSVTGNSALGGAGGQGGLKGKDGKPGQGQGGGLYVDAAAVCPDAFTQAHVTGNFASSRDPNIHGQWKRC